MAKTDFKNIDEYQAEFPPEIRERMETIRKIIHEIVPGVEEVISYQIPCFKYLGYLIYYAGFPNHVSISNPFSAEFLKEFESELKNYKVSKSVIQLPNKDELPTEMIARMIRFRKQENEQKPPKSKTKK
ncbi:DUF1801 domain-containing protein [Emticicia sp. CRIBPO]|uniref:iron chaperone n=1 Tax=Emticicia sp. CRIBPO TaxID=2683258 RepID=UPI001412E8FC|nr:DUF1801 domain-containing protein [Emticicia sp. CRIBPO]NBA88342.1 DUF1801 domain-containing protein [Emticicia sp. CRIBPO]